MPYDARMLLIRYLSVLLAAAGMNLLPAQELSEATYAAIRDHVLPRAAEQQWRTIPWRATLWSALRAGQKQDKPILLWAMNGHPLGCT